jgi:hypothetical protein
VYAADVPTVVPELFFQMYEYGAAPPDVLAVITTPVPPAQNDGEPGEDVTASAEKL